MRQKPSLRAIIKYTEGGYFGDSDIFSHDSGISSSKGRDAAAIGETVECTIFVMARDVLNKIKDNFESIYREMQTIAIKRYKNHQILIAKEVKYYI